MYGISLEIIISLYRKSLLLVSILLSEKKLLARSFNSLIQNIVQAMLSVLLLQT